MQVFPKHKLYTLKKLYMYISLNHFSSIVTLYVCFCGDRWIKLWHCEEQIKIQQIYEQNISTYGEVFWTKYVTDTQLQFSVHTT